MGLNFRKNFTAPSASIKDVETRARVEGFITLLIFRQFTFLMVLVMVVYFTPDRLPQIAPAMALNLFCYFLSRTKFYRIAAALMIIEPLISIPILSIVGTDATQALGAPMWLLLGPLIASMIFTARMTGVVILATCVSFGAVAMHLQPSNYNLLVNEFLVMISISLLALLINHLRARSDRAIEESRAVTMHSAKLASLGEMAGGVAHELNTPLAAITLNLDLMEEEVADLSGDVQPVFEKIRNIAEITERMAKVINSLRTFAREGQSVEKVPVPAQSWIQDCLDLCQQRFHNSGVQLRVINQDFETVSVVQRVQLSQALLNLLNNSFDAVAKLDQKWIQVDAKQTAGFFELRIVDSGPGISSEALGRLFQPFFTTKKVGEGVGLGLSVSRGILENHGGNLLYDKASPNTCFVMRLPILKESA